MIRNRWIGLAAASLLLGTTATAALPSYVGFDLQARVGSSSQFNLPAGSSLTSANPVLNDSRVVAFRFQDDNFDNRIWRGQNAVGGQIAGPYFNASDPSINAAGVLGWRVSNQSGSPNGVYSTISGSPAFLTNKPLGASAWGDPQIADNNTLAYRATQGGQDRYIVYNPVGDSATQVAVDDDTTLGFLGTPSYNNNGQIGALVWDATQSNQRQIRRFATSGASTILATPASGFTDFLNGVSLNDNGAIGFRGSLPGGKAAIAIASDGGIVTIADTLSGPLATIASFGPSLNNNGLIAFRATPTGGTEGIYVGRAGEGFARVIGAGDQVMTDLGPATVGSFAGRPDINNAGDISFNVALTAVGGGSIGRGIFVARVPEPASLALLGAAVLLYRRR